MAEFDFDYHKTTTAYPESGTRLQLGKSYTFASEPTYPDQRVLTLHFPGMFYFCHPTTGVPDLTRNPKVNFGRLEAFYKEHRLWKDFDYTHPIYGLLRCKFNKPLQTPKPIDNRPGELEGFTVELLEMP